MRAESDSIDLREVGAVLRRGWRWIAGGVVLGLLAATIVTHLLPRRFDATTTVLLRESSDGPRSALSMLSGMGGSLGGILPNASGTAVDTELEILKSRTIIGEVVDSLGLQARVLQPTGIEARNLLTSVRIRPAIERARYRFTRTGAVYEVKGSRFAGTVHPGSVLTIPEGQVTLAAGDLPESFRIEFRGREDVITGLERALRTTKSGGEVVRMEYRARDPYTAAAVPNALVSSYLGSRTTSDRGVNRRRFEFLMQKADSIAIELAAAETALRGHQEATGVIDPREVGAAELEQGMRVRAELETLDVEIRALEQALADLGAAPGARQLAAYPTFLQSAAINDLLGRLFEFETEMLQLLERRTEEDPEVVVLARSIDHLEGQLRAISRDYLAGLRSQRAEVQQEMEGYRSLLASFPASAEQSYRLEREVRRLAETELLLQAQLIDARLAAITEGGEVRQIDVAVPPRRAAFPNPSLNLGIGLLAGILLGTAGALGSGYLGRRVTNPWEAELATGIPVTSLTGRMPLLIAGTADSQSILVAPIGRKIASGPAARRIAEIATAQGRSVAVIELAADVPAKVGAVTHLALSAGKTGGDDVPPQVASGVPFTTDAGYPVFYTRPNGTTASLLDEVGSRYSLVVVALPELSNPGAVGILSQGHPVVFVARSGHVTRAELNESVASLQSAGIPTVSVILEEGE